MHAILTKRISVFYFFLFLPFIVLLYLNKGSTFSTTEIQTGPTVVDSPQLIFKRDKNHQLIQPLVSVEQRKEDTSIESLKDLISKFLQSKIATGEINTASVYFNDLVTNRCFIINPTEKFSAGSIIKIPVMMTYLKEAETNRAVLDKQIYFDSHFSIPEQNLYGEPLIEKRSYSVRSLISKMIIESDNDATALLTINLNREIFVELFKTLSLPKPDLSGVDYFFSVEECSRFLSVLFNSTYLNEENSEFALSLLTKTTFNQGLQKYLAPSVILAHKFGERNFNGEPQLHETGIVYLEHKPYLLSVLTKGNSRMTKQNTDLLLPEVLATISRIVLDEEIKSTP